MKKLPSKVAYFSLLEEIFPNSCLTTQTAQNVEFLFSNVAYRATVYKTENSEHRSMIKNIQLFQELIGNLVARCPNSHRRRRLQMSVNSLK